MAIIDGTNNPETLIGTNGDDIITGKQGHDIALMGAGNDRFVWNPGDGSDFVQGDAGFDTMAFRGAAIAEQFDIFAAGKLAELDRNIGTVVMDMNGVERIELQALDGVDQININDLDATAVREVAVDLAGNIGGGDGAVDTITVNNGNGGDRIGVALVNGIVTVTEPHEKITLANAEATDALVVNGNGGNDVIDATGLAASAIHLTLDGGAGNDKITGGDGADFLRGGEGDDKVTGGLGSDVALLGAGNDQFTWNAGDGSDIVEGEAGTDTARFNGSAADEAFELFANGSRIGLRTDTGDVIDMNQVERLDLHTAGGADRVNINNLAGTGVQQVTVDLAGAIGSVKADDDIDTVNLQGTVAADTIKLASRGDEIAASGFGADITIVHAGANDVLNVNGQGGDDVIDASKVAAGKMQLQIDGGDGADFIIGSAGDDVIRGGRDADTALMGAGNDKFIWNPGDGSDVVEGQAGFDAMLFNGSNISEQIDISANGGRVLFHRDVASITMDLNSVERIEFQALGGADKITINDLNGTGVKQVALDLGGSVLGGDNATDTVTLNTSSGNDHLVVTQTGNLEVTVAGLFETVTLTHAESVDNLVINGLDGNDTIDASGLGGSVINLTIDGGAGNDVIFGSGGIDTIFGGDGNDTVFGEQSGDIVDLGNGDDTFVWETGGGTDHVEGDAGFDTLKIFGADGDDPFQIFANGSRVGVLTTDNAVLDTSSFERIVLDTGKGRDDVTIGDLSGTGVKDVAIDLGKGSPGETINLTPGVGEVMLIETKNGHTIITNENTFQTITIDNAESSDVLNITGPFGNVPGEVILASDLTMSLHFSGTAGNDTIFSGSGDDLIDGNQGSDVAKMGAGNDTFTWDPGDGSDTVDGQAGHDTLRFNGSNIGEQFEILADGSHAELTRNIGVITMHLDSVERIELHALGGADLIHVHDMSGTAVKEVAIDLGSNTGTGDLASDVVTLDGSKADEHITITSSGDAVTVDGMHASVVVTHLEAGDALVINAGEGKDTIDASQTQDIGNLTIDGGGGDDTITGSHGGDVIFGGDGHDILKGGDGTDSLFGGNGDDVLTGGAGNDTLTGGDGADTFNYTGAVDGHDVIVGFTAGQDHLDLTALFDGLGVNAADRDGRVSITDNGNGSFDVAVDADGNKGNGFELTVATIQTNDHLTGQDVLTHH